MRKGKSGQRYGEALRGTPSQGTIAQGYDQIDEAVRAYNNRNVFGIGRSLLDNELIESSGEQLQRLGFRIKPASADYTWSVKFVTRRMLESHGVDAVCSLESYRTSSRYDANTSENARPIKVGKFVVRDQFVMRRVLPDSYFKHHEVEPLLQHCLPAMPSREVYNQQFFLSVGQLDLAATSNDRNVLLNALDDYQNTPGFNSVMVAFGPLQVQHSA